MTNSIAEIPFTNAMFVIGSNTTEAHPVIGAKMRQALKNGAKLIVADPRKIELAAKADVWLRLKPGTDIALVNGLMHIIIKNHWHDQKTIGTCTTGFEQIAAGVEKYTPEYVESITGVSGQSLYAAAKIYATVERASIFYTMGITEHVCGTDNVISLANLAMLTGNVGKPGTGVNPLRGQSNVQGSCDMGALPNVYPGYQAVTNPQTRQKFEQAWGVKLSEKPGMTIPDMMDAAVRGDLKALYIMGEEPLLSDANANHVRKGLENLDFIVMQNIFLTETGKLADVILPAASFAEKDGTFTNTERRVQRLRKAITPIGDTRADWQILVDLTRRLGYPADYSHPSEIMDEAASLTPSYAGINYKRIDTQGLQWPVPHSRHAGTRILHENGKFTCGLGKFVHVEHQPPGESPDAAYPFLLTTGCTLFHHRTSTARRSKRLTEHRSEERVMIHPQDAVRLQLSEGDSVNIISRRGSVRTKAWLTDTVPPGVVWMSFHFPDCPTNEVTSGAYDKVTKTYEYKVCAVKVEKV